MMYSGDKATPTTVSSCLRPLMTAVTESPICRRCELGKCLAHQHLRRPSRIDPASFPQVQIVQDRNVLRRNGNQTADGRLGHIRHIQRHIDDDARLGLSDARNLGDSRRQRQGCTFHVREDVGKPVTFVIRLTRLLQRMQRVERHHERADTRGDHQDNRKRLALDAPQISNCLAV